jgi:hypothetical protein
MVDICNQLLADIYSVVARQHRYQRWLPTLLNAAQQGDAIDAAGRRRLVEQPPHGSGTVRGFRQKVTLEDAIGSHSCSLEPSMPMANDIPLGCSLLLTVGTVNSVQILKVLTQVVASGGRWMGGRRWQFGLRSTVHIIS